jgi:hypothetical protein
MAYNPIYGLTRQAAFLGFYLDAGQVSPSQVSNWGYATADAAATVEASGYFNAVASQLGKGDCIRAVMALGGAPVLKDYVVTSASGATPVTIAIQQATAG